jgi:hypothetical protein
MCGRVLGVSLFTHTNRDDLSRQSTTRATAHDDDARRATSANARSSARASESSSGCARERRARRATRDARGSNARDVVDNE